VETAGKNELQTTAKSGPGAHDFTPHALVEQGIGLRGKAHPFAKKGQLEDGRVLQGIHVWLPPAHPYPLFRSAAGMMKVIV
jgi:hypothetical protein